MKSKQLYIFMKQIVTLKWHSSNSSYFDTSYFLSSISLETETVKELHALFHCNI